MAWLLVPAFSRCLRPSASYQCTHQISEPASFSNTPRTFFVRRLLTVHSSSLKVASHLLPLSPRISLCHLTSHVQEADGRRLPPGTSGFGSIPPSIAPVTYSFAFISAAVLSAS